MCGEDGDGTVHKVPSEEVMFQVTVENEKAQTTQEGGSIPVCESPEQGKPGHDSKSSGLGRAGQNGAGWEDRSFHPEDANGSDLEG